MRNDAGAGEGAGANAEQDRPPGANGDPLLGDGTEVKAEGDKQTLPAVPAPLSPGA